MLLSSYPMCPHKERVQLIIWEFGLINFYRHFIPHCAATLQPLNDLLKHTKRPSDTLVWTDTATTAFSDIKNALANASLLVHPTPDAPTSVMTDASDVAVGAVLQQYVDGKWCPIAFFSKALKPAEKRYSTSTGNCWPFTWQLNISDTSLRDVNSTS